MPPKRHQGYLGNDVDSYSEFLDNFSKRKDETKTAWRLRAKKEWMRQSLILGVTHEVHAPRSARGAETDYLCRQEREVMDESLEEAMDDIWEGR